MAVDVTSVDGDNDIYDGQSGVIIAGTGFGVSQGSGEVNMYAVGGGAPIVLQTVTAWSDTSITITVSKGGHSVGPVEIWVVDDGETSSDFQSVTLSAAPPGKITLNRSNIRFN